jgi:hypothetical protein
MDLRISFERLKYASLGLILLPLACMSSFTKTPAIPMRLSASGELDYIISTDRLDNRQNSLRAFIFPHSKRVKQWKERDEMRLARVSQIYAEDSVRSDQDKWNAGIIFLHGGAEITLADTGNYRIAYELFNALSSNSLSPGLKRDGKIWKKVAQARLEDLRKKYSNDSHNPTVPVLPHGRQ